MEKEIPKYNSEARRHQLNGIDYDGHFVEWKLEYCPRTYLKSSELSGDEYRKGGSMKIYMDGECVCNEFCREENMAIVLMSKHLHELKCFFEIWGIDFMRNWKNEIIGRKMYHAGVPSIVESYCGDGEIIVKTEDGSNYELYGYKKENPDDDDEWLDTDRVHITDSRIYWHRK